ncbi:hypothetical protein [Rhodococcus sp. ACS1]|uniref:hypothetical protein n=1 Tax=Rhodococcus sp. ACS1 TaxID=2028570 RepID=UPI001C529D78|nr:hypothetical protein [Rhodococcus sp. ACS1]
MPWFRPAVVGIGHPRGLLLRRFEPRNTSGIPVPGVLVIASSEPDTGGGRRGIMKDMDDTVPSSTGRTWRRCSAWPWRLLALYPNKSSAGGGDVLTLCGL